MEQQKQMRNPALDVIRIFAFFSVVSVHFFLNSGYYETTILGAELYIATLFRSFFMICVPLYMLLTGYLMHNKKASRQYYGKLCPIVGEYILASFFCMASRAIYTGRTPAAFLTEFFLQIPGIFSFEAAPYSWYVEMYIGLFLLIPYLNILYNNLEGKEKKGRFIFTLLLLSGIPEILNSVSFFAPWKFTYNDPAQILTVFPDWWSNIYPILYYFIGAYLSEYPLKLSKIKAVAILILANISVATISYINSLGTNFIVGPWQRHQSFYVVIQAVMVFHIILQMDFCQVSMTVKKYFLLCLACVFWLSWFLMYMTRFFTK